MKSVFSLWIILTLLFAFKPTPILGQSKVVDSLKNVILNSKDDTLKVATYINLHKQLFTLRDYEEALNVISKGIELSNHLNFPRGTAQFMLSKGVNYQLLGRNEEALNAYKKGVSIAKKNELHTIESKLYVNIGNYHYASGDLDYALDYYLKAYELKKYLSKQNLGRLLNNIAVVYRLQEKYDQAERLYQESYELKKEVNDSSGMAASLLNLGRLNSFIKGKEKLTINQLNESLRLYTKLKEPDNVANTYLNLGFVYFDLNNDKEAKNALEKAWRYFENNQNKKDAVKILAKLGSIAYKEQNFNIAENNYTKALALLKENPGSKQDEAIISLELSCVKSSLNKYTEAYILLEKAYELGDQLKEEKRLIAIEEMQTKFEVVQKEQLLAEQNLEIEKNKAQRNFLILGLVSFILLSIGLAFFFRKRLKYRAKIAEQEKAQLQQENKLTAMDSMIAGQEQERARIAKDLHDSLGGLLSSVKSYFQASQQKDDKNKSKVTQTATLIDQAASEVRRISHNMMPHALTIAGLKDAISDIAERLEQEKYRVTLELNELPKLNQTQEIMIYRLVQELIYNVKKHAEANDVFIQLYTHKNTVHLTIEDDGKGFDLQKMDNNGLGLESVKSRVAYLNGEVVWDSQPGKGTTVNVSFAA